MSDPTKTIADAVIQSLEGAKYPSAAIPEPSLGDSDFSSGHAELPDTYRETAGGSVTAPHPWQTSIGVVDSKVVITDIVRGFVYEDVFCVNQVTYTGTVVGEEVAGGDFIYLESNYGADTLVLKVGTYVDPVTTETDGYVTAHRQPVAKIVDVPGVGLVVEQVSRSNLRVTLEAAAGAYIYALVPV